MLRTYLVLLQLTLGLLTGCQQETTSNVQGRISPPRHDYIVLYDFGHNNVDDLETLDLLSKWLSPHGFTIRKNDGQFGHDALASVDILVVKNAVLDLNEKRWTLPTPSAFTTAEIEVLDHWVRDGGGLVIVADHMPIAGAAEELLSRFGVETSNGFAVDTTLFKGYEVRDVMRASYLKFQREDGSIVSHVINDGGLDLQRLNLVTTSGGSAFRFPDHGEPLLRLGADIISLLPERAWRFDDNTPRIDVNGWLQAGVVRIGRGRVAVLGDSQLLAVPWPESPSEEDRPYDPAEDNKQFTLNLFYWLAGRTAYRVELSCGGHRDRLQLPRTQTCSGWTSSRRSLAFRSTAGGETDRCRFVQIDRGRQTPSGV